MTHKVLLVEDERTLSGIVRDALETMDFSVELAYDGSEGLRRYFEIRPDILLVDVMMPKMSGFDMVKAIRQSDKETPILFLTAKTTVDDVVTGFNLGADDYLKKPFAIPELVVRMKNLLGRSGGRPIDQEKGQESYSIGEYLFTPESATLLHKPTGEATLIPRREADILQLLCKGSGSIIPTQNILLSLWGDDDFFNARSLQVLITRLRRALSKDPRIRIVNVRGTGYKLIAEYTQRGSPYTFTSIAFPSFRQSTCFLSP